MQILENRSYQRLPISTSSKSVSAFVHDYESEISKTSVIDLIDVKATGIEALIIPGGIKLFNQIGNFEKSGEGFRVDDTLRNLVKGMFRLHRPIASLGPASLIVAKSIQGIADSAPVLTVGSDPKLQAGIVATGAQAVMTRPGEVVLDETNRLVSSGGEYVTQRLNDVFDSCSSLIDGIIELLKK